MVMRGEEDVEEEEEGWKEDATVLSPGSLRILLATEGLVRGCSTSTLWALRALLMALLAVALMVMLPDEKAWRRSHADAEGVVGALMASNAIFEIALRPTSSFSAIESPTFSKNLSRPSIMVEISPTRFAHNSSLLAFALSLDLWPCKVAKSGANDFEMVL